MTEKEQNLIIALEKQRTINREMRRSMDKLKTDMFFNNILVVICFVAVMFLLFWNCSTVAKADEAEEIAHPVGQAQIFIQVMTDMRESLYTTEDELEEEEYYDSLEMLAICVQAEAGNQDLYGKRLVADVILNRVDSDKYPNTIVGVISQKYMFSTYWDGAMDRVYEPSEETFKAVQMELEHRTDSKILFFTAGGYGRYGTHAYQHGNHYFCY